VEEILDETVEHGGGVGFSLAVFELVCRRLVREANYTRLLAQFDRFTREFNVTPSQEILEAVVTSLSAADQHPQASRPF
jgi:hypothetical protein